MMPEADVMICKNDTLWVMGAEEDLEILKQLSNK